MLESTTEMASETVQVDRAWLDGLISEFQAELGALKVQMIAMKTDLALKDRKIAQAEEVAQRYAARIEELEQSNSEASTE